MSVIEKLITIQSCKDNIKQAITDKGVDMTNVAFTEYATKISEIQTGGGGGAPEGGSADYLELRANLRDYQSNNLIDILPNGAFAYSTTLESVDLPNCRVFGNNAFIGCTALRSVESTGCEFVENHTFENCTALETVDLPNCHCVRDYSFANCNSLRTVNIPNPTEIGGYAFKDCHMITSIDLPNLEIVRGESAFEECGSLQTVNIPKLTEIPANMFKGCVSLGNDSSSSPEMIGRIDLPSVKIINDSAFYMCGAIQSISAPNLTRICSNAFNQCGGLALLDISGTYWCDLENINAFEETSLMLGGGEIHVPISSLSKYQNDANWSVLSDRFVGVGDADKTLLAFDNGRLYGETAVLNDNFADFLGITKEDVSSIDLPNCLNIGRHAFSEGNLQSIDLPNCLEIGDTAFSQNAQLSSVNLPKCERFGMGAFDMCNLQSIDLPNCLEIGTGAFGNNIQLSSVNLPKCERIGNHAISGSEALTSVDLPNIKYIADYAFAFNMNLKTITIGNTESVCELEGISPFEASPIETIYVPNNLVNQYKSHMYWSQFADMIVGI